MRWRGRSPRSSWIRHAAEIGEAGYRTVAERFSIDAQVKRIEAVYDEELARAGVLAGVATRAGGTSSGARPSEARVEVPRAEE